MDSPDTLEDRTMKEAEEKWVFDQISELRLRVETLENENTRLRTGKGVFAAWPESYEFPGVARPGEPKACATSGV